MRDAVCPSLSIARKPKTWRGGAHRRQPFDGRVLIVDDVITAGTAIRESIELIRAAGARPAGVLLALDRQERAPGEPIIGGPGSARPVWNSGGLRRRPGGFDAPYLDPGAPGRPRPHAGLPGALWPCRLRYRPWKTPGAPLTMAAASLKDMRLKNVAWILCALVLLTSTGFRGRRRRRPQDVQMGGRAGGNPLRRSHPAGIRHPGTARHQLPGRRNGSPGGSENPPNNWRSKIRNCRKRSSARTGTRIC